MQSKIWVTESEWNKMKLIILDLDGTINDGWNLIPELKEYLSKLQLKGIKIGINTGRDLLPVLYYMYKNDFIFNFIGCAGGTVWVNCGEILSPSLSDLIFGTII